MTSLSPLLAYAAALAVAAVIPGPGVAALVGQALGAGARAAMVFMAGIILGDLIYLGVAIAGLAALAQMVSGALLLIKLLGGGYLLYMGWTLWRAPAGSTGPQKRGASGVLAGLSVTLGNPKAIIFYMALLPSVIDLGQVDAPQWLALSVLTVLVLLVALSPYVLLASRARNALGQTGAQHRLNRIASGVIGAAGALILGQAALALARRG